MLALDLILPAILLLISVAGVVASSIGYRRSISQRR